MTIQCTEDLRFAYMMLRAIPQLATDEAKREIRAYTNKPTPECRIVKEYGIDGYVALYPLPDRLETAEQAADFFEENERIVCPNSP